MNITTAEHELLQKTVDKLNADSGEVSYRLIEIKGTYYIYPEFPAKG